MPLSRIDQHGQHVFPPVQAWQNGVAAPQAVFIKDRPTCLIKDRPCLYHGSTNMGSMCSVNAWEDEALTFRGTTPSTHETQPPLLSTHETQARMRHRLRGETPSNHETQPPLRKTPCTHETEAHETQAPLEKTPSTHETPAPLES